MLPSLQPGPRVDHLVSRLPLPTIRPVRLAFASDTCVVTPTCRQRQLVGSLCKGTPSLINELRPLVGARFQELFHSSVRSAFHLSLTVLVRYRSLGVFSLTGWSRQIHAEFLVLPRYSGYYYASTTFRYATVMLYGLSFQKVLL